MLSGEHRRELETRLRENLKRDRAKTEFLRISQFGLIEMTRQRMRPPLRKSQFMTCPTCEGRGTLPTPESTANEAMRDMAYWIAHPQVASLEIAVGQGVAGMLLSRKRRAIVAIETETGKRIDIRVSHEIPDARVDFYAYDDHKTDLDLPTLAASFPKEIPPPSEPMVQSDNPSKAVREVACAAWPDDEDDLEVEPAAESEPREMHEPHEPHTEDSSGKPRRKRRRHRSRQGREPNGVAGGSIHADEPAAQADSTAPGSAPFAPASNGTLPAEGAAPGRKKRRRRGRRGRGKTSEFTQENAGAPLESASPAPVRPFQSGDEAGDEADSHETGEGSDLTDRIRKKRRRRRSRSKGSSAEAQADETTPVGVTRSEPTIADDASSEAAPRSRKKRRRRSGKPAADVDAATPAVTEESVRPSSAGEEGRPSSAEVSVPKTRRRLYGSRRRLTPAELASVQAADEG